MSPVMSAPSAVAASIISAIVCTCTVAASSVICRLYRLSMVMAVIADTVRIRIHIVIAQAVIIRVRVAVEITDTISVLIYKIMIAADAVTVQIPETIAEIASAGMTNCWRKLCRIHRNCGSQHNHAGKSHSQHFLHN